MTTMNKWLTSLAVVFLPLVASADPITYDIAWTGFNGSTMTGVFVYDSSAEADGFVRDRDAELVSLELSSSSFGGPMTWTWNMDSSDPFNFNFIVAGALFPSTGAVGSTEAQWWNGSGTGLGLGVQGNDGRIYVTIDGRPAEATLSLVATRRAAPAPVPEPAALTLLGLGLASLGFARRKSRS